MIYPVWLLQEVERQRSQELMEKANLNRLSTQDAVHNRRLSIFSKIGNGLMTPINNPSNENIDPSMKDCVTC